MSESGSLWNFSRAARNSLLLLVVIGCVSAGPLVANKLDPVTAVTITYSSVPFIFFRDNPGRGAFARNYVNFGPIEVNAGGSYRYYLWLGIWSTVQDVDDTERRDRFESIVLIADGELLLLDIAGWTPAAIGASEPVYVRPVASADDAYYAVTVDQIRLIAEAKELRLMTSGNTRHSYELWDEQASARESLAGFMQESAY